MFSPLNFCPRCGAPVEYRIPEGDDRKRRICTATGEIFYDNPRNVVGTVVEHEGRILMCRRAIEPRHGFWTLPAGFLELGETCAEGAMRETLEEACAQVSNAQLFSLIDIAYIGQIHMFFTAQMHNDHYAAGPESLEARFVSERDIDWSRLAFPSVYLTLRHYFADRAAGTFGIHMESLARDAWQTSGLATPV